MLFGWSACKTSPLGRSLVQYFLVALRAGVHAVHCGRTQTLLGLLKGRAQCRPCPRVPSPRSSSTNFEGLHSGRVVFNSACSTQATPMAAPMQELRRGELRYRVAVVATVTAPTPRQQRRRRRIHAAFGCMALVNSGRRERRASHPEGRWRAPCLWGVAAWRLAFAGGGGEVGRSWHSSDLLVCVMTRTLHSELRRMPARLRGCRQRRRARARSSWRLQGVLLRITVRGRFLLELHGSLEDRGGEERTVVARAVALR
mmetsp:Transcript_10335/g.31115  ORF Transcript_10335/g.31115 Transcript_10335/m.31115 type:complete len:257 (-) Transcript_10335:342-1112(-)